MEEKQPWCLNVFDGGLEKRPPRAEGFGHCLKCVVGVAIAPFVVMSASHWEHLPNRFVCRLQNMDLPNLSAFLWEMPDGNPHSL